MSGKHRDWSLVHTECSVSLDNCHPHSSEEATIEPGAQILGTSSVYAPSMNIARAIKSISSLTFLSRKGP